jgi:hypothetical protein
VTEQRRPAPAEAGGAGQWEASFCRGHLNLSTAATGLATFGYWGALTVVRISLALVPRQVAPQTVVRSGSGLARPRPAPRESPL